MAVQVYSFVKDTIGVFRPWIPIRIFNPADRSKSIIMHALLDTGADECVFPKTIVDSCGFDLKAAGIETKEMQGVGKGKISVWFHTFRIELLTPDLKKVFWASKDMKVACLDHDDILPILGFTNCLGHFKITFNHATKKIIIDDKPVI